MQQTHDLFRDLPTLETPRLTLRKIRLGDLHDQFHLLADESVTQFLPLGPAISPENRDSQRVGAKVGMRSEGLLRESHQIRGVFRDHLMYALLKREWAGAHE